ncbi:MAG: hypothetical protein ABL982_10195, partial [Vicinamibacterales bacterium]
MNWAPSEASTAGCYRITLGAPECNGLESPGNVRGANYATMAFVPANGSAPTWYKTYNEGWFLRVIQTSDGGYLAVGTTASTRKPGGQPLYYNPNQVPGQVTDTFSSPLACALGENQRHINLVKVNATGVVQWEYLYGMTPYQSGAAAAYSRGSDGWDVIETTAGYRLVGNAQNGSSVYFCNGGNQPVRTACMIEVDPNGLWLGGQFLNSLGLSSNAAAISQYVVGSETRFVVSATELFMGASNNPWLGCDLYQKVRVSQYPSAPLTATLPNAPLASTWTTTNFDIGNPSLESLSQSSFDVQMSVRNGVQEILFPIIVDCQGCIYSGNNSGQAKVYRLNLLGQIIDSYDLGIVEAFDLMLRVAPAPNGGFGFVSTRRPVLPPPSYVCPIDSSQTIDTSVWNSDAYVGYCNACGNVEWATTFNVNGAAPAPYPGDWKKQECMYSISTGTDGGYVVSGNNSFNFDDNYLAKLNPATPTAGDLYIRDTPVDIGLEPNPDAGPMYVSEDIWVCNQAGCAEHENPEYSPIDPVYVRVRVKNKGCLPASGELKVYWSKASTGLYWPTNWVNFVQNGVVHGDQIPTSSPILITNLPANAEVTFSIPWHVPDPGSFPVGADGAHFCLLARIETSP